MINIFIFSFISSIYLICAGHIFLLKKNIEISEIYTSIFFGSFLLSIIGLFLNFFIPLDIKTNTILLILIFFIGFFFIIKNKNFLKIIYCSVFISIISTLILSYDTIYRPDANLYHLPYTQIINENKIIFGVSNIHFRFGHISIIQYLNAIFNNFIFKENGIIIPAAIIFSAIVLYFYNEIKKNINKDVSYAFYIFLLFAYILYGYNRYSEFGNDTIAHLYFLLISSYFLRDNYKKNISKEDFIKLLILSLFCFMLKTSLIFVFIIPLYIFLFKFKKIYILNIFNLFVLLVVILWFVKNIITSGCIIYPIEITCFENFEWFSNNSKDLISANVQSLDNEAWTKGWPDYKGQPVTQTTYVENFFWFKTWALNHGLLIVKKLLIFLTIIFIIFLILKKNADGENLLSIKPNYKLIILLSISATCVFIWFIRFPVFRYGSSYIVVLLTSLLTLISLKYDILNIKIDNLKKYINIFIIIFIFLFFIKHTLRIYENNNNLISNSAWPQFPKKKDTKDISSEVKIDGKFVYYLLKDKDGCGYTSSPCSPYPIKNNIYQEELNGYKFFLIKN